MQKSISARCAPGVQKLAFAIDQQQAAGLHKFALLSFVLLLFLLSGCSLIGRQLAPIFSFRGYSFTPSQAITKGILEGSNRVQNFKLLGTRRTPDGKVAGVYTFYEPGRGSQAGAYVNGYSVAERVNLIQWRVTLTSFHENNFLPKKGIPIDYEIEQESYKAVFGPVLSQDVTAVEVTFTGGETARETISEGYFLIFSPEGKEVCEIRATGAGEKLLYQANPSRLYLEDGDCPMSSPD